ncbi:hypothetical protein [Natrinema marinum]|uniref:hypothetical protein n=1 Tax=Natrinema marinum TaxID=2961598 RepID=UPI0020C9043E|nr:hypothetical protein [Natrinema marinum]
MTTEFLEVRFYIPDRGTSVDIADLLRYCGRTFDLSGDDPSTTRCLGPNAAGEFPSELPLEDAIERVSSGRHGVLWFQTDDIEFGVYIHPDTDSPATVTVSVPDHYVRISRSENVRTVVDNIVIPLYEYTEPVFVYGGTYLEDSSLDRKRIETGYIDRAFWLLAFGPRLVQTLGEACLEGLTTARFTELSDGGRLLLLSDNPNTCTETQRSDAETVLLEECGL